MESNGVDYKALCKEYERRMGIGENDPAKDGYLVLIKILRQQNEYLNDINVKDMITKEDKTKATAEYERAKSLWENLSKMIQSVNMLRMELKMEGEERREVRRAISATSMAEDDENDE